MVPSMAKHEKTDPRGIGEPNAGTLRGCAFWAGKKSLSLRPNTSAPSPAGRRLRSSGSHSPLSTMFSNFPSPLLEKAKEQHVQRGKQGSSPALLTPGESRSSDIYMSLFLKTARRVSPSRPTRKCRGGEASREGPARRRLVAAPIPGAATPRGRVSLARSPLTCIRLVMFPATPRSRPRMNVLSRNFQFQINLFFFKAFRPWKHGLRTGRSKKRK